MREINECTAEVFRRSEKRIKDRKRNRNRILMCCVPFLICLTVFSAAILPAMMTESDKDNAAAILPSTMAESNKGNASDDNMEIKDGNDNMESIFCSFMQAEIQDVGAFPEHYELVTDKLKVDQMYFLIYSTFENTAEEEVPDAVGDCSTESSVASKTAAYIFTFTTAGGAEATYSLSGNKLVANETGEIVYLNADRLAELQKVFLLPN